MTRALCFILCITVPTLGLAQTPPASTTPPISPVPPPPPSYPPVYPPSYEPPPGYPPGSTPPPPLVAPPPAPYAQPQPNLRPYAPLNPAPLPSKNELPLEGAELLGAVVVSAAATAGAYVAATSPGAADASLLILILFSAVMPIFVALPIWGLSFLSDTYEVRFWPMVEAGSTVAGIAVLLLLIGSYAGWNALPWVAAVGLIVGVPVAEVIQGNWTKLPKGMGLNMYGAAPTPWDRPVVSDTWSAPLMGKLFMFPLPALTF